MSDDGEGVRTWLQANGWEWPDLDSGQDLVANALAAERALDDRLIAALRSNLAAERAEVERLRAALVHIQLDADIIGDSDDARLYIDLLNDIWKMADDALHNTGGPS